MTLSYKIRGFHGNIPALPHQLADRVTPIEKSIVLCHLGVPEIAADDWRLIIDGMVDRPSALTFAELKRFPYKEIESVHQCAGSPLNPHNPTQRVCNVIWGGARLADILYNYGVQATARFVWSTGSDSGVFADTTCEAYVKDIPVDRIADDVLVAYEMNRKPLLPEHGYPARLFVPGFYGTNSVKWLRRLTLAGSRASGPFTTRWYNDPVCDKDGRSGEKTEPVWAIAPQSVVVSPAPHEKLTAGSDIRIWGWAWSDGGAQRVDVSVDAGHSWFPADLESDAGRRWQHFEARWTPPNAGPYRILSRATNAAGASQPLQGRRNAVYSIQVQAI